MPAASRHEGKPKLMPDQTDTEFAHDLYHLDELARRVFNQLPDLNHETAAQWLTTLSEELGSRTVGSHGKEGTA